MKQLSTVLRAATFSLPLLAFVANAGHAQDPLKAAPGMYSKLFENDRVRVLQVVFKPGDTIAVHAHPDHFVYPLSDGKLIVTIPGQKPMEADVKAGGVMWMDAQKHSARNVGGTELKLLVVELKGQAHKK